MFLTSPNSRRAQRNATFYFDALNSKKGLKTMLVEVTVVSSLDVAETFGKQHAHVLRDIKELECSEEFRLSNFGESSYINSQNKKQPMYYMTKELEKLDAVAEYYNETRVASIRRGIEKLFSEIKK